MGSLNEIGAVEPLVADDLVQSRFRVNRRVFTDPAILASERSRIFDRCWLYLGHESEIPSPGSFVSRRVGGRPLILIRDRNAVVRAFFNSCAHRGAMVCRERKGVARGFQCPYHGWSYLDDGTLLRIPGTESYAARMGEDGSLNLRPAPRLDSYRGFVFVNYDRNAAPLQDYLAGACDILALIDDYSARGVEVVRGTYEYSIRANWKLLLENSADAYHAATTHGSYFEYLKSRDGALAVRTEGGERKFDPHVLDGRAVDYGNGHAGTEMIDGGPWGRPVARWVPGWGEDTRDELDCTYRELEQRLGEERAHRMARGDRNTLIFPNLVIIDNMGITIRTFYPIAPDHMEVNAWSLGIKGESPRMRNRRLQNFIEFHGPAGLSTPDDAEVLEICQRGYAGSVGTEWNDISKGMRADLEQPKKGDELQMRTFWRRWHQMIAANAPGAPR